MTNTARLWTFLLVPPLAWTAHLYAAYSMHAEACASKSQVMLWILSLALAIVSGVNAFFAFAAWRSMPDPYAAGGAGLPDELEPRPRSRARFMALTAFAASLFFLLVIAGQTVPMILLRPCD